MFHSLKILYFFSFRTTRSPNHDNSQGADIWENRGSSENIDDPTPTVPVPPTPVTTRPRRRNDPPELQEAGRTMREAMTSSN